jgi:tRNA(Arg) A34 adenosine deaminase TadA
MSPHYLLTLAAEAARSGPRQVSMHGAVGVRKDGCIVVARNATSRAQPIPEAHAETRVLRKMDRGGEVYVARVMRATDEWGMSRPCPRCMAALRARRVARVWYTVSEGMYESIVP